MKSAKQKTELLARVDSIRFRSEDGGFLVASISYDKTVEVEFPDGKRETTRRTESSIVGADPADEIAPGLEFRFFGHWQENPKFGLQFSFSQFVKAEPSTRISVVAYLRKNAPGVGPAIGGRLWDQFGPDAVKQLRTKPEETASLIKGLTIERALEASKALGDLVELETTKIELGGLLDGRGFPKSIEALLLKRYGLKAPERIRRDPFFLLLENYPGAGFQRVDKLYLDLGLPPASLKRQTLCLWNCIKTDRAGHSWFPVQVATGKLRESISSAEINPAKALELGVRSKLLATRRDENGNLFFTIRDFDYDENRLAEYVRDLLEEPETVESIETGKAVFS